MKSPKPKKGILLIVPYTIPDYSGSGINALNFGRFLASEGEKVSLLTFNRNLKGKRREDIDGLHIQRITYFNRSLLHKIFSLFFVLPAYLIWILRSRTLVIYGAHIIGYRLILIIGRLLKRKVVFRSLLLGSDDMSTIDRKSLRSLKGLTRRIFNHLDLYFAINPEFAGRYTAFTGNPDKVFLSPQGVDTQEFRPVKKAERESQDPLSIVSIGFLINRKGFSGAFRALAELDIDLKYTVAGEHDFGRDHFMRKFNNDARELKRMGKELLGHKLIFLGPVRDTRQLYQSADLVLINSHSEGLPNVMLEAMACGRVVLIRSIPGSDYLIDHLKTGLIYHSEKELTKLILKVNREPELIREIGRNAREKILNEASFEIVWKGLKRRLGHNE